MADEGWKQNDGSSARHPQGEVSEIRLRDGREIKTADLRRGSADLYWRHDDKPADIVAYR